MPRVTSVVCQVSI